ncbi:J domain-containing protein ASCRUDRAFT_8276 [Ascoidea rubescens DSM 1968]|uniref:J domain-containing protein n=1 Tax=Ascoidea rubescens DSM 1968 TaxID=1344418 RepID=A0A1D2VGD1_9ASCO|nr:hypothetical protein ASCRUDRAFT_8276 [Ascoidea rubescens DSM 1968]ODV60659.1 hypothetical protein ASCRUDRAFT_8276 [Ascoidea rubescens DSM 1968]
MHPKVNYLHQPSLLDPSPESELSLKPPSQPIHIIHFQHSLPAAALDGLTLAMEYSNNFRLWLLIFVYLSAFQFLVLSTSSSHSVLDFNYFTHQLQSLDQLSSHNPETNLDDRYNLLLSELQLRNSTPPASCSDSTLHLSIDQVIDLSLRTLYKKAILNVSLKNLNQAITDLSNFLNIYNLHYNTNNAKENEHKNSRNFVTIQLLSLYLQVGNYDAISALLNDSSIQYLPRDKLDKILTDFNEVKLLISNINKTLNSNLNSFSNSFSTADYNSTSDYLSSALAISHSNPQLYLLLIKNDLKYLFGNFKLSLFPLSKYQLTQNLLSSFLSLSKLLPLDSTNYLILSNLYLFQFSNDRISHLFTKRGIHYDFDNSILKLYMKFFSRNINFFALFNRFKSYNDYYFIVNRNGDTDYNYNEDEKPDVLDESHYTEMLDSLLSPDHPFLISNLDMKRYFKDRKISNNFQLLNYLSNLFNNYLLNHHNSPDYFSINPDLLSDNILLTINNFSLELNKIILISMLNSKPSHSTFNLKDLKFYANNIIKLELLNSNKTPKETKNNNYIPQFFPAVIPKLESLLKSKNINQLKKIFDFYLKNNINKNKITKNKLFQKYYKKFESLIEDQNQQNWNHQSQRQQRHQQVRPESSKNNYYKILAVPRNADQAEIKMAYRALTKKFHPDKYQGNNKSKEEIEAKMSEINRAYEVLSNKELKERYDNGDDPNDPHGRPASNGGQTSYNFQKGGFNPFGTGTGSNGRAKNFHFNFGGNTNKNFFQQSWQQKSSGSSGPFAQFFGQSNQRRNNKKRAF